jgi:VWFA-related protein
MISTRTMLPLAVVLLGAAAVQAQTQAPPQPVFRARTDLVAVDVSVLDDKGRPVTGLTAADFTLMVDGKPRTISSVEFVSYAADRPAAPPPANYSTNAATSSGRLILFVVDQNNLRPFAARSAILTAGKFLDRLTPADRVGLAIIPQGRSVEFTANHSLVKEALARVTGESIAWIGSYNIGISEAFAIASGDTFAYEQAVARECRGDPACPQFIADEANARAQELNDRTSASVTAINALLESLRQLDEPKTIVLISEGLYLRNPSDVAFLSGSAAAARATFYALHVDSPAGDAGGRNSPTATADAQLAQQGLEIVTGYARGTLFRVTGAGEFAFDRLSAELSGYYLLSFEPASGDRDGRSHKINVQVSRRGVTLRARREFAARERSRPKTADEWIGDMLRAPFGRNDIALKLATFTLRDATSDKLKVVVGAEIDPGPEPTGRVAVGFIVIDEHGTIRANALHRNALPPRRATNAPHVWLGSALLDPGRYTIKLAAVDEGGRGGSLDHSFTARLTRVGDLEFADMIVAEELPGEGAASLSPAFDLDPDVETLGVYLEVYARQPDELRSARIMVEIAQNDSAPALVSAPVRIGDSRTPTRRPARALVSIGLLPPGDYLARAVVTLPDKTTGRLLHPVRIPERTAAAAGTTAVARRRTAAAETFELAGFDRQVVLDSTVVGPFLGRLGEIARDPTAAPLLAAFDHAKSGRFEDASREVAAAQEEALAGAFVRGLHLLAKGDLENAAGEFRKALAMESDFFPALFYLGACYAAGGRDREAVAAWQTSLITETESPIIYRLLSDALLRMNDHDQAIAVLREAVEIWPRDRDFLKRLATAYIVAGQAREAYALVVADIDENPEDPDALFLGLRLLYEAHTSGKALASADEDRAKFSEYAKKYGELSGPQQELVAQWIKVVTRDQP